MEKNAITLSLVDNLLKEIGEHGKGNAWVAAWQAVASESWSSVEGVIRSSFRHDPATADRVIARYDALSLAVILETKGPDTRRR